MIGDGIENLRCSHIFLPTFVSQMNHFIPGAGKKESQWSWREIPLDTKEKASARRCILLKSIHVRR
jgi:hypothetical protein